MASNRDGRTPPVRKACPKGADGKEACSFYYEGVSARETNGDWLAQFCHSCSHLMFIDKKKLTHGASS